VVENGAACEVSTADHERMTAGVRQPEVDIWLDLGLGESSTELFFADMGHEYITINAEYHT
jgi:N-acetylglutamate synthase/N-acetylornithine aminotransferase